MINLEDKSREDEFEGHHEGYINDDFSIILTRRKDTLTSHSGLSFSSSLSSLFFIFHKFVKAISINVSFCNNRGGMGDEI